jgi:hypothetical protein
MDKFDMKLLDEGYDDEIWEEFQKRKKEKKESDNFKGVLNYINSKNLVILIVWGVLYKLFIKFGFGAV